MCTTVLKEKVRHICANREAALLVHVLRKIELTAAFHNFDFYKNARGLGLYYDILLGNAVDGPELSVCTRSSTHHRFAGGSRRQGPFCGCLSH